MLPDREGPRPRWLEVGPTQATLRDCRQTVVIEQLPNTDLTDPIAKYSAVARLRHPQIVRVIDAIEDADGLFLIRDFARG